MSFFRRMFNNKNAHEEAQTPAPVDTAPLDDTSQETADSTQESVAVEQGTSETVEFAAVGVGANADAEPARLQSVMDGATRQLTGDLLTSPTLAGKLLFGQTSDTGMVRQNNQDSAFSFFAVSDTNEQLPSFGLFVVADGMGGHHDGEKASSLATRVIGKYVIERAYLTMLAGEDLHDADRPPMSELLTNAVRAANDAVMKQIPDGGTTVTAVIVMGEWAYIAHVGDSRAYVVTKEGAEQITRDHTLVQRLIELNQITIEEGNEHPQKNVLYRAIGQNESVEIDTMSRRLPPNASLLLCSDGLWGFVSNVQMREVVATSHSPQEACDKLVALANALGSTDNITAVIVKMPSE